MIIKKSLVTGTASTIHQLEENKTVFSIMSNCKNSIDCFYKYGLISMIVELANKSINV